MCCQKIINCFVHYKKNEETKKTVENSALSKEQIEIQMKKSTKIDRIILPIHLCSYCEFDIHIYETLKP